MNKIYKVIWNRVRHCYVVVSEIAKNHGKEHSTNLCVSKGLVALTLAIGLSLSSYAFAAENTTNTNQGTESPIKVDLGNGAAVAYDNQKGNLTIGDAKTVAEGTNKNGKNNTTIGTQTDTLRNVTEGDTKKDGQPLDGSNTKLVDGEGKAHPLDLSTEAGGSTAVGYQTHNEGDNSTAIGNNAKISNKPVTYYVDADGNKTASADNAAWYKDASGNPTKVPQVFRDADGNTTATPQYIHTYTEKDPATGENVTKTEITSDAAKADKDSAGNLVYNYKKEDNTDKLYSVTLYQAASNSIAAGTNVTANGSNAVAVGYSSTADNSAVAIGDTAAAKENAVAIGKGTNASAEGSIALGKGAEASRDGGVAGWDPKTGTDSTKSDVAWKSGEGALSIGNGGASRQITNVAAGSEDSDAVNLAQLKNAMTHYYSVKTTSDTDAAGGNNYLNDGATGNNALAAGVSAVATGDNATAVGTNTYASGMNASAYGYRAVASGLNSVAIGSGTSAQQEGSVAIGGHTQGSHAVQVGTDSTAQSAYSVAVGGHAKGEYSVEVGYGSTAQGSYSTSIGGHAIGKNSIAIGRDSNPASAGGDNSIAIGGHTNSTNDIAIGAGSSTSGGQAIAVGGSATGGQAVSIGGVATSSQATAVGNGSAATGSQSTAVGGHAGNVYSTAVGQGANATYAYTTAVGNNSTASGDHSTALGYGTSAQGSNTTAIGGANANGTNLTVIGNNSTAGASYGDNISNSTAIGGAHISASDAAAIGSNATVNGQYGVALGHNSNVSYASTGVGEGTKASNTGTAVGYGAQSFGYQSAAVGAGSNATGQNAVSLGGGGAWGDYSIALGSGAGTSAHAIALGQKSGAWGENAIAIGEGTNAWRANSIVLGKNSKSGADKNIEGYDPRTGVASVDDTSAWYSTDEAVSIGRAEERDDEDNITVSAITRQLNNLAAGTLDTDAVNVAQLKAATQKVNMHDYSVWSPDTETDTNYTNGGAVAKNSMAAGVSASTTKNAENAVAIGYGAQADGYGATVIGQYGKATGRYALAFGGQQTDTTAAQDDNVASGDNALSFGERTTASGTNSTAFGWQTTAKEKRATAFGERTTASGANATAFGQLATASGQNSVAFGNEAVANNYGSTAFGNRTEALGEYSTAFGNSTVAAGMNTAAFGTDNVAGAVLDENGAYTNIIYQTNNGRVVKDTKGNPIEISREKMDARGNLAYLDGSSHTKSVTYTVPGGETHSYVLLQGTDGNTYIRDYRGNIRSATIGTDGTVTVGDTASAAVTLKKATAGANGYHILSNANATVWGENSIASGEASTAFGVGSIAAAKNSLAALGGTVAESATNAAAIGSGAQATLADSVALGSHSVTTRAKYKDLTSDAEKAAYAKGTSTGSAWQATDNAIAVGNDSTVTRQITGVAAGSLDTDAVNVAQLKAVDARHTTVSVGGQQAQADNALVKGGNLEMTRTTSNGQANYDVSLNKDIVLGQQEENKGGSIVINSVGTFREYDNHGNHTDYPMKEAVKIDGTTVSVVKHDGDNDQRQVVMGVGQDTGGYVALYDNTGKKPTYIFNAISPGITYLKDKATNPDDANEFGRLEYGDIYNGSTQFIATLDDGLKFSGDQGSLSTVKLNQELSVTGGVTDTNSLSTGSNIGVVSTPAVEDLQGNIQEKAKLELKLNKDLTDLNTVTAGSAKIGRAPADTLKLTENGVVTDKTAPDGSYVTGLDNKDWSTTNPSYVSGRAATEDQLAAVSGTINQGLSFTTNTKDATNTTDNYKGYKVVNRKLGNTIAIKASDETDNHSYSTKNLTTRIAENGDISILMDENPAFTSVTTSDVIFAGNPDLTDKDGKAAQADTNVHYGAKTLTDSQNITTSGNDPAATRLHYKDEQGHTYELATMDDGQIYAGDIKTDGTTDTTGFGRKMNEKTTINGGVTNKDSLTDGNIGVVSNGTDILTVKLAKDLKDLTSVTTGKTVMDDSGIKITNDAADETKNVVINGDKISYGGNQVTNMGSGADGTADGKPTYNTDTNGANIGDVKNIASSTTDAAKLTGDSNIIVTYNDPTAGGKNTVKLNDSITLGSDADKKVTIDGTAGTITAGDKVSLNGSTGIGSIGGVTIGNQTGVATTKMDGDKAKTEDGTFVTGLTNTTWNPDSNGIVSGRAATEDQLKTVSDTVNAGWELDVNGTKRKAVTPTSPKVNFVQGQNITISGSGDDVTVATADNVRFASVRVGGDADGKGGYTGGIVIGQQSGLKADGKPSANPNVDYYITGLKNTNWDSEKIQSGRAATEDQLKHVADEIKNGTVAGDVFVTGGGIKYNGEHDASDTTSVNDGKGSLKLTLKNQDEPLSIDGLHDYYAVSGTVSADGKTLTIARNETDAEGKPVTFDVDLTNLLNKEKHLIANPADGSQGVYKVNEQGEVTLQVQDAAGNNTPVTISGLDGVKGLNFDANTKKTSDGKVHNVKLGGTIKVQGVDPVTGHDYSADNVTTEVDDNGNITIKLDKALTADTVMVNGKDGRDGQIGLNGKDGKDGTVTTIIRTIGKNGTDGTDGITRIVYQDGKDGESGTTTHTVATLDDGLKFGANHPVAENGDNPVGNTLNSTINIKGAGTKTLDQYSGKNLVTSVEQDDKGNTTINVLMDKNISADGVTVGQAGRDGKDGLAGTIGINGKDGKDGITTTIIRTEKGQPGKDGTNGKPGVDGTDITRIVYQNGQDSQDGTDGKDTHTVATLDDGLKFAGDDGQNDASKVITRKLNERLDIVGKAQGDLTDANIGVTRDGDGQLYVRLAKHVDLDDDGTLEAGTAKMGAFSNTDLTTNKGNHPVEGSYATGLSNRDWNVTAPEYVKGRAATEDQLAKVSEAINNATTVAGKRTVVTVNDKSNPAEATPSATAGEYGDYDSTGGNLMIAAKKDSDGAMTYNIKLNDQLAIGQKGEPGVAGKDGKDGKVTVETKGGTTVVIGHDGEPGKDGKDGLFVTGKDGADGVSITGPNGADGTDGKVGISGTDGKDAVSISGKGGVGHIGLTGPKGEKGKDGISIDITTDLKSATLDDGKNVKTVIKDKEGKETTIEQAPRIQYQSDGKNYEVATMDDGLKFVGNDGKEVSKKLNSTLSLTGGITDEDALQKASSKNLGVRSNEKGDGLEIVMTDTPDFTKVTVGEGDDTTKKITIGNQTVTGKKSDGSTADQPQTGNYITGLDNKAWDKDNVVENRAATEGQLRDVAGSITNQANGGGFALTSDEKGDDKIVKQDLGKAIQIKGDTTYKTDGSVEKAGNIKTSIDNGAIKVELNKDVDLGADGSVKAGSTTINKDGVDTNQVKVGDVIITKDGINGGSKQITNMASGIDGKQYDDAGDNNAASIGDVKQLAKNEAKASEAKSGKNITVKGDHTVNLNDDITLGNDATKQVTVKGSEGQVTIGTGDSAMTLGKQANTAKDGNPENGNYLNGLNNRKWDGEHIQNGRAATEDQLKKVSDAVNKTATQHTIVTVNDNKDNQDTKATPGKGAFGDYAGADKGNLLIAAKNDDGQMTYNIKLNDQLTIGQKGEPGKPGTPGKDGKVTVETRGGTTVVIGHDGKDGDNGKDGLFVTGKDGKDGKSGVSITGPDGVAGKDGVDGKVGIAGKDGKDAVSITGKDGIGHIGLTGQKGEDGKDGVFTDFSTTLGTATLDPAKNEQSKSTDKVGADDKSSRIQYQTTVTDKDGKTKTVITHEVATMDDGLKFVGNDGKEVTKKLNSTLPLTGGITDEDALQKASGRNLGVRSNKDGNGLEIVMTDTPDFTKVTVGEGTDPNSKITIGKQTVTGKKSDGTDGTAEKGNYITGLDNTKWNKDNVVENRAATEGQLRDIAGSITNQNQGGGFALTSDEKGDDKIVKQDLGKAIQIKGDTTYKTDGSVEKAGNIKTSIDNGAIKVELNKDVDLTKEGSIKAGETTIHKDGVDTNKITIKDSSISISKDGINGGNKQITNVASGATEITKGADGKDIYKYDNETNAANIGDVKRIAGDMKTEINNNISNVTNKVDQIGQHVDNIQKDVTQLKTDVKADRTYQGDDGAAKKVKVKFGSFLSLTGGAKLADLTEEGNIGVVQKEIEDPDHKGEKIAGLSVRLAKHLNLEKTTYTSNENGQTYTSEIDGKGLTIKTGDENRNITVQDGNVNMGGNQIHNVAPGQAPGDAVNVSQLNATNYAVNKLGTRVNRVGAGAAALAALHPLDFDPDDKWDFAAGYGNYKDASAVAVGAYYRPNEDTMFNIGGSFGGGENMVNAGVSFKVGQGNHVSTSRVAMAKEIKDLRQNVANLNAIVNRQSALIDKLTGTNAGMIKDKGNDLFPDVPANHWAYEYVTKLKQAGILTGYPDGNFDGDRMMTRYEFAAIVYRAIMAGAASNPALNQDGTLDKLANEFSSEMKYIRIDTIAKDKNGKPTIERVRVIPDTQHDVQS